MEDVERANAELLREVAASQGKLQIARHHERTIRQVTDVLPVPVLYVDREGICCYANRALEQWVGARIDQFIGSPAEQALQELCGDALAELIDEALAGRRAVAETICRSGDRQGRPLTVSAIPHGENDSIRGAVLMIEDAASRKRAADELNRSEATTRAILDAAVDGIVTIDGEGRIESFNRAAEKIFGYAAAEVIGLNVNRLMPEPYHSDHDTYIRNYLATGQAKIIGIGREVHGLRKDGTTFPIDLAVGESHVDGRRIFAGIVRDISERKATEEKLRHSEERFRLLVEGVRDYAITVLDTDGHVTSWNQGAERITGWRADEITGRHFSAFFRRDGEANGPAEKALATLRGHGRFEEEGLRVRKDGSVYWAHEVITPLRDDAGETRGYVSISRDMTEHKLAEEALRSAKEEAERAREEAERANFAKSKFLAAASHDLRQPVQALFFFSTALARKLQNHPARSVLGDLERSLEALNMLLDSLLDISKLDAGVVTAKETSFTVASLLDRMEAEFAPAAQQKGLRMRVVPSSATIRSDPALLSRVLQNLVANALRYTARGTILLGCRRRGRQLSIEVWDSGIGIPPDRLHDIFEEFYQIGNPERDRNQGLGLGLAIVDRLVKLLGHRISVSSVPGRGSVFRVEVPLVETRRVLAPPQQRPEADETHRLVMIIDDEVAVLRGLRMIMEEWGYEVLAASSEDEAMQLLRQHHRQPHAIVADYRLRNGRTGTEAIRQIRNFYQTPIPSIIITGDTAPERLREAEASGLNILHKPVQPPQLHTLLNDTIGNA